MNKPGVVESDRWTIAPHARGRTDVRSEFEARFNALFDETFHRLYRYLDRLSGDPALAADLAQEAFVRLYRRGEVPDLPAAWLITVAMNLFRNERATERRRRRLLGLIRGERLQADPGPGPDELLGADEARRRVREALDRMPERDRRLLLLHAEGFSYREIGRALELNETSVGTLLARARQGFRRIYGDHASS